CIGPVRRLRRFGRNRGHRDVSDAHAAVLLRHVWQPETPVLRRDPHLDDRLDEEPPVVRAFFDLGLARPDHLGDETSYLEPQFVDLGRKREVDGHEGSPSAWRDGHSSRRTYPSRESSASGYRSMWYTGWSTATRSNSWMGAPRRTLKCRRGGPEIPVTAYQARRTGARWFTGSSRRCTALRR